MIGVLVNGVPGHPVENLKIEHVRIEVPGGGTAGAAKVQLPEKEKAYPEFDTFGKTMPAYGIYARHVRGLNLDDVRRERIALPLLRDERLELQARELARVIAERAGLATDTTADSGAAPPVKDPTLT